VNIVLMRIWAWIDSLVLIAFIAGFYAAVFGSRLGGWIFLGAVVVRITGHLVIGGIAYWRTMCREWPHVEPVPFFDDD